MNPQQERQAELRDRVGQCLWEALLQVCGGSLATHNNDEVVQIKESCRSSISCPNKSSSTTGGKPQDLEVRLALSLFHRWKQQQQADNDNIITIISDMGLQRQVASPAELAALLIPPLESSLRREGIAHDVQCHPSGFIGIVTGPRAQLLRQSGKLPCPHCPKWCQGTKGLWWHQQQCHNVEHSEAASVATCSMDTLAIIPYNNNTTLDWITETVTSKVEPHKSSATDNNNDPLEMIKDGDLPGLQRAVTVHGYQPATHIDHRGASPLMWAAGSGNLDIVRYLIEHCNCDPSQPQKGKRSFSGRTALHWAARKGHLAVVQYLVSDCQVNIEAATVDGTTAFGWASWQGHRSVMEFLATQGGCDIHRINSFGCNAVLWCAQGQNGDVDTMKWLQSRGCHMTQVNHNGHGVLHKAAQRGQTAVCQWFWDTIINVPIGDEDQEGMKRSLRLVGPDTEGYCPSDLAGMEGHEELARTLANWEMNWITTISSRSDLDGSTLPAWLENDPDGINMRVSADKKFWEPLGGVRRMKSRLV